MFVPYVEPNAVAVRVAVLNNGEMYKQILGNRIVQANTKCGNEGSLCLMILHGRLASRALVIVVDIYYVAVSSHVNQA
jgi:hypothetical protein